MKHLLFLLLLFSLRAMAQPDTSRYLYKNALMRTGYRNCYDCIGADTCFLVSRNSGVGLIDGHSRLIIPMRYDGIRIFEHYRCPVRLFETQLNGLKGLVDGTGNVLFEPIYSHIDAPWYPVRKHSDLYFVVQDSLQYFFGVVDHTGKEVVPISYVRVNLLTLRRDSIGPDRRYALLQLDGPNQMTEESDHGRYTLFNFATGKYSDVYSYLDPIDSLIIARKRMNWSIFNADFGPVFSSDGYEISPLLIGTAHERIREEGYDCLDFRHVDDSLFLLEQRFDAEVVNDQTVPDYKLIGLVNIYTNEQIPVVYHSFARISDNRFWAIRYDEPGGRKGVLHIYNRKLQKIRTFRFSENAEQVRSSGSQTIRIFKDVKGKEVGLDEDGNIVL